MRKATVVVGAVLLVFGLCMYGAGILIGVLLFGFGGLLVMYGMLPETTYACPRCRHGIPQGTRRCPHCGNDIPRSPRSPFESAGLMLRGKPYR